MAEEPTRLITRLLAGAGRGDEEARCHLLEAVYNELRRMAQAQMAREASGRTLQPTALVHEAYLRLFSTNNGRFENRRHFFAAAAQAMHRICVDDARRRKRLKRGGGFSANKSNEEIPVFDHDGVEILALDEALATLSKERPELVELVRFRFFVGLSLDETAEVMNVSRRTVANRWRLARAWLFGALGGTTTDASSAELDDGDGSLGPD